MLGIEPVQLGLEASILTIVPSCAPEHDTFTRSRKRLVRFGDREPLHPLQAADLGNCWADLFHETTRRRRQISAGIGTCQSRNKPDTTFFSPKLLENISEKFVFRLDEDCLSTFLDLWSRVESTILSF